MEGQGKQSGQCLPGQRPGSAQDLGLNLRPRSSAKPPWMVLPGLNTPANMPATTPAGGPIPSQGMCQVGTEFAEMVKPLLPQASGLAQPPARQPGAWVLQRLLPQAPTECPEKSRGCLPHPAGAPPKPLSCPRSQPPPDPWPCPPTTPQLGAMGPGASGPLRASGPPAQPVVVVGGGWGCGGGAEWSPSVGSTCGVRRFLSAYMAWSWGQRLPHQPEALRRLSWGPQVPCALRASIRQECQLLGLRFGTSSACREFVVSLVDTPGPWCPADVTALAEGRCALLGVLGLVRGPVRPPGWRLWLSGRHLSRQARRVAQGSRAGKAQASDL